MANVLKVSQSGYDVKTAGDQNLVFSSEFPVLKEEKSGLFDATGFSGSSYVPVYEHNLDYDPFFLIYNSRGQFALGSDWAVDDKKLYVANQSSTLTGKYRWIIYRLKLFEEYEAPALKVQFATAGGDDRKFGIKISKEGKDVHSDDLRDFTIHSRARTPLIHKVSVKDDWATHDPFTTISHTVDPGLPYNPIVFGFSKSAAGVTFPNLTTNLISGGQAVPKLTRNSATRQIIIESQGATTSKSSIVIFKDPILAPKEVRIDY